MAFSQLVRILGFSILAGLIAGGILAILNLMLVQPYLARVTDGAIDELIVDGKFDEEEFDSKVRSIYVSQTAGSLVAGVAAGSLIAGVFVFSKMNAKVITNAIIIAAMAWFVLYVVPSAKYPASAVALFDEEAASQYYPPTFGYIAFSGLAALGIATGFRRTHLKNKIFGMAAAYLVAVAIAYIIFPNYDLDSGLDQTVLNTWRSSVSVAVTAFWFSAGIIGGVMLRYGSSKNDK